MTISVAKPETPIEPEVNHQNVVTEDKSEQNEYQRQVTEQSQAPLTMNAQNNDG